MMNEIERLNQILFDQLETLSKINVKDEDFMNVRLKAETMYQLADRVIRNSELALRHEVWQATRRYNLATRETKYIRIGQNSVEN